MSPLQDEIGWVVGKWGTDREHSTLVTAIRSNHCHFLASGKCVYAISWKPT